MNAGCQESVEQGLSSGRGDVRKGSARKVTSELRSEG